MKDKELKVEEVKVPHTLGNTVWTPPKTPVRCGVMCPTGRPGPETGTGTVPRGHTCKFDSLSLKGVYYQILDLK
jgi:hypothetical protein